MITKVQFIEHFGVAADLTQEEDRQKCAAEIKAKFSHLDVLVHNAGMNGNIFIYLFLVLFYFINFIIII